jgi:hypothetical protein
MNSVGLSIPATPVRLLGECDEYGGKRPPRDKSTQLQEREE